MADTLSRRSNDESGRTAEFLPDSISISFPIGENSISVAQLASESGSSTPGSGTSAATAVALDKSEFEMVGGVVGSGVIVPEDQKENLTAMDETAQLYSEAAFLSGEIPENLEDDSTLIKEQRSEKVTSEEEAFEKTKLQNQTSRKEAPENEAPENEAPENEVSEDEAFEKETPENEAPAKEIPAKEIPAKEIPAKETPEKRTLGNVTSESEASEKETPGEKTPEEITPEERRPEDEASENKAFEKKTSENGTSKDEASKEESSESRLNSTEAVESVEIDASKLRTDPPVPVETEVKVVIQPPPKVINPFGEQCSDAAREWQDRKQSFGEESNALDELMTYKGLERVKKQFLDMKSKYQILKAQSPSDWRNRERLNIIFQGNPGTGKTTIARLYAKFLKEIGFNEGEEFVELSGIQAAAKGVTGIERKLKSIASNGGVLFIDEAYQLVANYLDGTGRQVLDLILTEMENKKGRIAVILVGYKEQMEPLFQHNPGLLSRIPHIMNFDDFDNSQLWQILVDKFKEVYRNDMQLEGGEDGINVRIAIRRLAQARGSRSFGNARAVENMMSMIADRQARRLIQEQKRNGCNMDYHIFTQGDLIGPEPSLAARSSPAYAELQKMIGLEQVKESIEQLIRLINFNYQRELQDKRPIGFSLNQVFVGAPGTGKTTVAGLYGKILADLGYLSRGDVVFKTAADFIGQSLGSSEANTKRILDAALGKVLVIDEAYMLDVGESGKDQDKFKTAIIDTMVSMIQGTQGEDRCVILIGYEDKMMDLFRNSNPGFSRRFPIQQPYRFDNFTVAQLEQILRLKIEQSDLEVTEEAIGAARDNFTTALMRPNFTNGGEVDGILAVAKKNYEKRLYRASMDKIIHNMVMEAADFDPKFDRGDKPEPDFYQLLAGQVDDTVINQLVQYFYAYSNAKKIGLNPRDVVATNFVFKGGPGSGKTTTAKQMGNIFYNMGYLSTSEVIECSAADLIGQYVGQTAPKARKKLQEGLGHVLLIDEVHRLTYSGFSIEAIDELVNFVSRNAGKVVVIIAGFTVEVSQLLSFYPDLAGHFSEVIVFPTIKPTDCIKLLASELAKFSIGSVNDFLHNPRLVDYQKIKRLFHSLSVIPFWNNARDVKSLAKQMVRQNLGSTHSRAPKQRLAFEFVARCLGDQILQRRQRIKMPKADNQPSIAKNMGVPQHYQQQVAPLPPPVDILVPQNQEMPKGSAVDTQKQEAGSQKESLSNNIPIAIAFTEPLELLAGDSEARDEVAELETQDSKMAELHHKSVSEETQREQQEAKRKQERKKNRRVKKMEQLKGALSIIEKKLADGNGGDDQQSTWVAKQDDLKNQIAAINKKIQRENKAYEDEVYVSPPPVWEYNPLMDTNPPAKPHYSWGPSKDMPYHTVNDASGSGSPPVPEKQLSYPGEYIWPSDDNRLEVLEASASSPMLELVSASALMFDPVIADLDSDPKQTLIIDTRIRNPLEMAQHQTSTFRILVAIMRKHHESVFNGELNTSRHYGITLFL
ncbi:P-loop containing nucleoside triphosphate hydrolase protein [Trichoderma barbatum]